MNDYKIIPMSLIKKSENIDKIIPYHLIISIKLYINDIIKLF